MLLLCNTMRGCEHLRLGIVWPALYKAINFMPSTVQLGWGRGWFAKFRDCVCFLPSFLLWFGLLGLDGMLEWFLPPCRSPLLNRVFCIAQQPFNSSAGRSGHQILLLLLFASLVSWYNWEEHVHFDAFLVTVLVFVKSIVLLVLLSCLAEDAEEQQAYPNS